MSEQEIAMLKTLLSETRTRLAEAEEQRDQAMEVLTRFGNVDKAAEIASLVADLAAARRDGICKDASIVLLQEEVLKARRALEEKERWIKEADCRGAIDWNTLAGSAEHGEDCKCFLASESPREERG